MEGTSPLKDQVRAFWDAESCGARYLDGADPRARWEAQSAARYRLEPFIFELARFHEGRARRVLEIGVGLGADSIQWLRAGAEFTGIDLTPEAVRQCKERAAAYGFTEADIRLGDAEALPFPDASFDLIWSWGVLHHTPDTHRAFFEAARVLRPGGLLRAMIYHDPSWVNWMLWLRYGAAKGISPRETAFRHLESPGTKCYGVDEATRLLAPFGEVLRCEPKLCPADLLEIRPSRKHQGRLDALAWWLWPRPVVRALGDRFGSFLLIEARK